MSKLVRFSVLLQVFLFGCATGPTYDTPPLTPVNISPVEQADILLDAPTTFVWQASDIAEFYEFHIFNKQNADIEQYARRDLRAKSICQSGQCSLTLSVSLPYQKNHAWRVRAGNAVGFSGWTRTQFNMVGGGANAGSSTANGIGSLVAPSIPNPVSPKHIDVQSSTLVEFVWQATPDATGYDFHLFDTVNAEMVDTLTDVPATTVCQAGELCRLTRSVRLLPADAHAWRIRAVNQNGHSAWTRTEFSVVQ